MPRSTTWRLTAAAALASLGTLVAVLIPSATGVAGAAGTTTSTPPKNTSPPTLTGSAVEGSTLTATPGSWSGAGTITYTYRFLRCDTNGGSCYAGGTTIQKTYVLTATDVGATIRVEVIAANAGGSTTARSAPTAVVKAATPPVTNGCPAGTGPIQIAQLSLPAQLVVDRQNASPVVVGRSTPQVQVRFHVSACNGRDVQGALVYVTAVPYNQFSIPPEASTGLDGWASLTMTRLSGFPAARNQSLLVLFVRARKAGEDLLGGVSARRLLSFPVNLSH